MKYLILIHSNPMSRKTWNCMSGAERAAGRRAQAALVEDLAESGELVVAEALAEPARSKRVWPREGRTAADDGPFAKEYVAGFILVDCADVDRAIEQAARVPEAALGLVEVRPVLVLSGLEM